MRSTKAPYIPPDQFELIIKSMRGQHQLRNRVVLLTSFFVGLRAKEIAALRRRDLLDPAGSLRYVVQLTGDMTKGGAFREVYFMDERLRRLLTQYLDEHKGPADQPVFISQKGGGFTANTMQKMIKGIYTSANVKASSHSGRRSFATRLVKHGSTIYEVKTLMGHSSITTTEKYLHTDAETLMATVRKLSNGNSRIDSF